MCEELRRRETTKPLLTIAIPTYNRAWCMRELLPVLADELKDEPRVELIISDNASRDETPLVVQDFVARGLTVRYIRNPQNIGADANFLQCFEQARGKYVWIFSDDDLIVPGGLARILFYCEAAEYDLIWVSSYSFGQVHIPRTAKARRDAVEISDPVAYVKRIHVFFSFITGNIVNKDTVLEDGPKAFSSLIGTGLAQLGWTYTALNRFSRGLYIREELIAMRVNNTGGYKLFQVFGPTLATITKTWLNSANLGRIVMNGTVQRFWPSISLLHRKSASAFADETNPQAVLTPLFKDNIRYWIFAYPVIVLPLFLAGLWVLFVRLLNRLDKAAGYPLLYWRIPGNGADRASKNH
ncbi:MAG TPA: glycosyltransferase family 2 protein [Candidatus Sulfotelmatobacter sp.]|jgi:glycosyltransferase involved in cell wall biosynthesis|nr:glycosyltransferase family 2 protein [Candidatus Sulfotelmatobacter sp.]